MFAHSTTEARTRTSRRKASARTLIGRNALPCLQRTGGQARPLGPCEPWPAQPSPDPPFAIAQSARMTLGTKRDRVVRRVVRLAVTRGAGTRRRARHVV